MNTGLILATTFDAVVVEGDTAFTLPALCRACGLESTQLMALVDEGVLDPVGQSPQDWLFDGSSLRTALAARRLMRDLDMDLAGVAMVLDLLAEIATLRSRLGRTGAT
jgi:chaperone modulatory protein CbpM